MAEHPVAAINPRDLLALPQFQGAHPQAIARFMAALKRRRVQGEIFNEWGSLASSVPLPPMEETPPVGNLLFTPPGYPSFTNYQTVALSQFMDLAPGNYIINVGDYVRAGDGPTIIPNGGNVVIRGGRITITNTADADPYGLALWPRNGATIYIEGLRLRPNPADNLHIHDGIVIRHNASFPSNANSRIILQNCLVGPVSIKPGLGDSNHADVIQWQSDYPGQLWIDRFTATSDYSGFMQSNWLAGLTDIHHTNLRGVDVHPVYSFAAGAVYYQGQAASVWQFDDFWIELWPPDTLASAGYPATAGRNVAPFTDGNSAGVISSDAISQYISWPNPLSGLFGKIRAGNPPGGDYVTEADVALPYNSPGYA